MNLIETQKALEESQEKNKELNQSIEEIGGYVEKIVSSNDLKECKEIAIELRGKIFAKLL
jgi:hypothetical protein